MYLPSLSLRLAAGAAQLPAAVRRRHAHYLRAAQRADGGFAGREGPSDPYYTGFALRGMAMLGELDQAAAERAAGFLASALARPLSVIDFLSVVYSAALLEAVRGIDLFARARRDRRQALLDALAPLRRPDGGCAKTTGSPGSSTYLTFLAAMAHELTGVEAADRQGAVQMVLSRQRGDGGFAELAPLRQSGTNPTAAAVGLLAMHGALEGPVRACAAAMLASMQTPEGGLRANTRVPVADLLSTFTGLAALAGLDALSAIDASAARRFVESLELRAGGFRGAAWDAAADVEYTFYGLGTLALLTS